MEGRFISIKNKHKFKKVPALVISVTVMNPVKAIHDARSRYDLHTCFSCSISIIYHNANKEITLTRDILKLLK